VLPLFCDRDLEINPMTLKLKGDLNILKMYPQTENELKKICQKLRVTSSIIVTDIPIKSKQFPTSSFRVALYYFFTSVTLTLDHKRENCDLDILKRYLQTENEDDWSSHSKYIAGNEKV